MSEALIYNGVDITADISIMSAVHDAHMDGQADTLEVICNDPKGLWSKWNPQPNDTLIFKYDNNTTGLMYLRRCRAENGLFYLFAASAPLTTLGMHRRKWEGATFLGIAGQIASQHGMSLKSYGVTDGTYKEILQKNQSDFEFLYDLAQLEGCDMLCYDGALIIVAGSWMDSQAATDSITIGENGQFSYSDSIGTGAAGYTVVNYDDEVFNYSEHSLDHYWKEKEVASATFNAGDGMGTAVVQAELPVQTAGEAFRWAKGLTRRKNQYLKKGRFRRAIIDGIAPGTTINIKTDKAGRWNEKVVVYRVRNDYVKNTSTIFFRHCLSGY